MTNDERSLTAAGGFGANTHNSANGSVESNIVLKLLTGFYWGKNRAVAYPFIFIFVALL